MVNTQPDAELLEAVRLHAKLGRAERKAAEREWAAAREAAERDLDRLAKERRWNESQRKLASNYPLTEIGVYADGTTDVEEQLDRELGELLKRNRKPAVMTPANPTPHTAPAGVGYLSPEEYAATPFAKRQTSKFRERLEKSRQSWPQTFDPHDLPQLNEDGTVSPPRNRRRRW